MQLSMFVEEFALNQIILSPSTVGHFIYLFILFFSVKERQDVVTEHKPHIPAHILWYISASTDRNYIASHFCHHLRKMF